MTGCAPRVRSKLARWAPLVCCLLISCGPSTTVPLALVQSTLPSTVRAACGYGATKQVASVREKKIQEASALAASQQWPGTYWTLNDKGNSASVFAFDEQGRARGTFQVNGARNADWEALQLGPGRDGGYALYVGDIGDNDSNRRDATIYRVDEPTPLAPNARSQSGRTAKAEAFRFTYPDGPHNAEALLVHPLTGEILIVTKDLGGRSGVYSMPLPLDSRGTARLERVADLDVSGLGPSGGQVTDATVSPDATRVTVRTYTSVLEYDVPEGALLASIWGQQPRVSRMGDGPKGEGITYSADGLSLMTISEGSPPPLFQTMSTC